ncbi:amidase [Alcaligenaceae bacterium]|nr:amidase [Alcaligenaceae bacterium]
MKLIDLNSTAWSVRKMSAAIADQKISPVDLIDICLDRISRQNGELHAFTEVYENDARLAAEAAHKAIKSGHRVGPLHGIPIAIKDMIDINGKNMTDGSVIWRNRISTCTGTVARRLIEQGLIIIGKTHLTEFAASGWGLNSTMGTPRNPRDMAVVRAPGGSSSGSAVAVAAGMVPWAIGTDTGGSVRIPSSWCGLTGLKTTIGRVSTHGVSPLSRTLDTVGPMANSAEDAALLYSAIQGPDLHDVRTQRTPPQDNFEQLNRGVKGLRFARINDNDRAAFSPDVLKAYDASLAGLSKIGAEIVDISLPYTFSDIVELSSIILFAEGYAVRHKEVDDISLEMNADIRSRLTEGRNISSQEYLSVLMKRRHYMSILDATMADIDAILTPTTVSTAPAIDEIDLLVNPSVYTRFANFFNLCSLAIPNGIDTQGLPTSLQIIGKRYQESTVLRIGHCYQTQIQNLYHQAEQ